MARFYGSLNGSAKTQATRQGHASTGITGHIRGWNVGIEVRGLPDADDLDNDSFWVTVTGGSNGTGRGRYYGSGITWKN
jgi:hypothetical protein